MIFSVYSSVKLISKTSIFSFVWHCNQILAKHPELGLPLLWTKFMQSLFESHSFYLGIFILFLEKWISLLLMWQVICWFGILITKMVLYTQISETCLKIDQDGILLFQLLSDLYNSRCSRNIKLAKVSWSQNLHSSFR